MTQTRKFSLVFGVFIAILLVVIPPLATPVHSGSALLCDDDEVGYYLRSFQTYRAESIRSVYVEHATDSPHYFFTAPSFLVDYSVGFLGSIFSFSLPKTNTVLDFTCIFLGFLVLRRISSKFCTETEAALVAGLVICTPWISYFPNLLPLSGSFGPFVFPPKLGHSCLPLQRSVYTQWGVVAFLLGINQCLTARLSPTITRREIICSGLVIGATSYIYIFSFLTTFAFGVFIFLFGKYLQSDTISQRIRQTVLLTAVTTLTALPTLLGTFGQSVRFSGLGWTLKKFPDRFVVSPWNLLVITVFFAILPYLKRANLLLLAILAIAAAIIETTLPNLKLLNPSLYATMHFATFFTTPLLSLIFFAAVAQFLRTFPTVQTAGKYLALLLIASSIGVQARNARDRFDIDYEELVAYLKNLPLISVQAINPYFMKQQASLPQEPELNNRAIKLAALTSKSILFENWMLTLNDPNELAEREILSAMALYGKMRSLGSCDYENFILTPPMYLQQWHHLIRARIDLCQHFRNLENPCAILDHYRVDRIIEVMAEKSIDFGAVETYAKPEFMSRNHRYRVWNIESSLLRKRFQCE